MAYFEIEIDDDLVIETANKLRHISDTEYKQTLDESAMILRKQGRADLAFRLDELRKEL